MLFHPYPHHLCSIRHRKNNNTSAAITPSSAVVSDQLLPFLRKALSAPQPACHRAGAAGLVALGLRLAEGIPGGLETQKATGGFGGEGAGKKEGMERGGWGVRRVGGMGSRFFKACSLCGVVESAAAALTYCHLLQTLLMRTVATKLPPAAAAIHPPCCAAATGSLLTEAKYLLYTTLKGFQRCPGVCAALCDELAQRLEAKPAEQDVPRWVLGLESVLAPVGGLRLKCLTVWHAGIGR